jgi:hypothetical protein
MITRLKYYENKKTPEDEEDLVELFSQKFIEKYWDKNFDISADDASNYLNLWNFVDDERVKEALIKDKVADSSINDFSDDDLISYIKEELMDKPQLIIELDKLRKEHKLGPIKYEDILKKITREELEQIVEFIGDTEDFMILYYENFWADYSAEDIMNQEWGQSYEQMVGYLRNFVDDDKIIENYKDRVDFEYKFEYVRDCIGSDIRLQEKLLDINVNTVGALFDIMDDESTIGNEYDFQKLYIEQKISKKQDIAEILKGINDKFGLNKKIKKEYSEYTYLIDAEQYNL